MSRSFLWSGLAAVCLMLAGCGSSTGSATRPAVSVNGAPIPLSAYNKEVTVLRGQEKEGVQGIDPCDGSQYFAVFCHQLKQTALTIVIREELIRQYARAHRITVTGAEFARQWEAIVRERYHGDMYVVRARARFLELTVGDLENQARSDLLQNKVMYQVTKHMSTYAPAVRLARLFARNQKELQLEQRLLRSGQPFNKVAQTMSLNQQSLCAQQACGDLGWYPLAFVPKAQYSAIASAQVGSIVGPFAGQGGFGLFLIEGRTNRLPMSPTQQLAKRQRLFAEWLAQQQNRATVRKYVVT